MPSPLTVNREKKKSILMECIDDLIDLISAKEIERDRINMADYKKLRRNLKEMKNMAFCIKRASEIYTKDSENQPLMDMAEQDIYKGDDFHEK